MLNNRRVAIQNRIVRLFLQVYRIANRHAPSLTSLQLESK